MLSALFGALFVSSRGRPAGVVLALVSFSHWVLDAVVHRADMPLLPANALGLPRIGLGLWRFPAAAGRAELLLVVMGAILYWRAALATGARRPANLAGAVVLASGLLTLGLNLLGL